MLDRIRSMESMMDGALFDLSYLEDKYNDVVSRYNAAVQTHNCAIKGT